MRAFSIPFLVLLVGCNQAPDAVSVVLEPDEPTTTADLVLTVEAPVDPDGDPVTTTITWFLDGDAQGEHADATTIPASATAKHQTWRAYVVPSDGSLEGPASSIEVTILNTSPEVELSLSPHELLTTEDVTPTVVTSDADEDEVTVTYQWLLNDEPSAYADPTLPAAATERGQLWTLVLTPNDGEEDGEVASATVSIENTAPAIDSVILSPEEVYETSTITAEVEASDEDGDAITLSYAWYVNGKLVLEGAEPSLTGVHFDKHQRVHVEVRGNDGFIDGEALASSALTVQNSAPSITGVSLVPEEIREETLVSCSPQGYHDADGDEAEYSYVWEVDGGVVSTGSTLDGTWFDESQTVKCSATPGDGEDTGTAFTSVLATVQNTPPVLASATLSTTAPVEGDTVTVTLGALTDVDGDPTTVRYAWFVDGVEVSTAASIDSTLFDKHQEIYVEVTPNDGDEDGAMVPSVVATALNTAPVIDQLGFSSSVLYTDDLATLDVDSSDADGDSVSLTYAWALDGEVITETGPSLDGATWFEKGQLVSVVVTPSDGEASGSPVGDSLEVSNSLPSAPAVLVLPTTPSGMEDDLICSILSESVDADEDSVSYEFSWDVDGVAYEDAVETDAPGDTVPGSDTVGDQVWTCSVTPSDGSENGSAGSDFVEVGGAFFRDDFDIDYGWTDESGGSFSIVDGALVWDLFSDSNKKAYFPLDAVTSYWSLGFDLIVEDWTWDGTTRTYALFVGATEDLGGYWGETPFGQYAVLQKSSSGGVSLHGSVKHVDPDTSRSRTQSGHNVAVDVGEAYRVEILFGGDRVETMLTNLTTGEETSSSVGLSYSTQEMQFAYAFVGILPYSCATGTVILDNFEFSLLDEEADTGL